MKKTAKCNHVPGVSGVDRSALRCVRCGEYMPLGPANDDSEAVQVEIRAAELADTDNSHANEYESLGWATFYSDGDLIGSESLAREIGPGFWPGFWSGWLAAEIYEWSFGDDVEDLAFGYDTATISGRWPWNPSRPVAGQYEEWLAVNGDLTLTSDGDVAPTVTIDSDGSGPAAQINGIAEVAPMFTPDEADALADELAMGADAARQAAHDGYTGPAVVVELVVGEEPTS